VATAWEDFANVCALGAHVPPVEAPMQRARMMPYSMVQPHLRGPSQCRSPSRYRNHCGDLKYLVPLCSGCRLWLSFELFELPSAES
jgi:hypothetical protein